MFSTLLGGITFGYDQGVIANVLVMKDFQERFPLSSFQVGLLSTHPCCRYLLISDFFTAAVLELGALFGAIEAGVLANKLSRRDSIILSSGQYLQNFVLQLFETPQFSCILHRLYPSDYSV